MELFNGEKKEIKVRYITNEYEDFPIDLQSSITILNESLEADFTQVWCKACDPFCNQIEGTYLERVEFVDIEEI